MVVSFCTSTTTPMPPLMVPLLVSMPPLKNRPIDGTLPTSKKERSRTDRSLVAIVPVLTMVVGPSLSIQTAM